VANIQSKLDFGLAVKAVGGTLTRIAGSPFAAGTKPYALAVDREEDFSMRQKRGIQNDIGLRHRSVTGRLTPAGEVASP
jgi:hypothetical protein